MGPVTASTAGLGVEQFVPNALVTSSFLLLVVWPGATSSFLLLVAMPLFLVAFVICISSASKSVVTGSNARRTLSKQSYKALGGRVLIAFNATYLVPNWTRFVSLHLEFPSHGSTFALWQS